MTERQKTELLCMLLYVGVDRETSEHTSKLAKETLSHSPLQFLHLDTII